MSSVPAGGQPPAVGTHKFGTRNVRRIPARILTGVVSFLDFLLLLLSGWLGRIALDAWGEFPSLYFIALAGTIGAGTGCVVLAAQHSYTIGRLRSEHQIWPILKAVVLSVGAVIACLFLVNAEARPLRVFPFAFGAIAILDWEASALVFGR